MVRNRLRPRRPAPRPTREEVAALRAKGLTVRQIAGALGISTQAVYKHLKTIEEEGAA